MIAFVVHSHELRCALMACTSPGSCFIASPGQSIPVGLHFNTIYFVDALRSEPDRAKYHDWVKDTLLPNLTPDGELHGLPV